MRGVISTRRRSCTRSTRTRWRGALRAVPRRLRSAVWTGTAALRKVERAQAEAAHTQRVLLYSLQTLLRAHADLDPALALVSLTAAITQLGVEGALAVMRQRPDRLGLPPPSRSKRIRQRVAGERAKDSPLVTRLEPEVRAYARAPSNSDIAECWRAAQERENTLHAARNALDRATQGHGSVSMAERRRARPDCAVWCNIFLLLGFESSHSAGSGCFLRVDVDSQPGAGAAGSC